MNIKRRLTEMAFRAGASIILGCRARERYKSTMLLREFVEYKMGCLSPSIMEMKMEMKEGKYVESGWDRKEATMLAYRYMLSGNDMHAGLLRGEG